MVSRLRRQDVTGDEHRPRGETGSFGAKLLVLAQKTAPIPTSAGFDPGRERRAEQRARELLKSCVNEEEWAMYRDLGLIRVWGGQEDLTHPGVGAMYYDDDGDYVWKALEGRGCRLGNAVVPRPSEPAVATICERSGEVMQGFLMHGAERIAICCPVPLK